MLFPIAKANAEAEQPESHFDWHDLGEGPVGLCKTSNQGGGSGFGVSWSWYTVECSNNEVASKDGCSPPPEPPRSCAGNPVDFLNGEKIQQETDFVLASNSNLKLERIYRSKDKKWYSSLGALGSLDARAGFQKKYAKQFAFYAPNGCGSSCHRSYGFEAGIPSQERWEFTDGFSGKYDVYVNVGFAADPLPGAAASMHHASLKYQNITIDQVSYGPYVLTLPNGKTYYLDRSRVVQRLEFPDKTYLNYNHTANGYDITDHLGNVVNVVKHTQYDSGGIYRSHEVSYTFNGQHTFIYRYQGDLITEVEMPDGSIKRYGYQSGLLTSVTDEAGVQYARWQYDAQQRPILSEHADGVERYTFAYDAVGNVTVTNALGKSMQVNVTKQNGRIKAMDINGNASLSCAATTSRKEFDDYGKVVKEIDNKGGVTTFQYDSKGREIRRTEAAGSPVARSISTQWHNTLLVPAKVSDSLKSTTFDYDVYGNLIRQAIAPNAAQ